MLKKIYNLIKKSFWFITGKCKYCGGGLWAWDWNKYYCKKCDKLN